MVLVEVQVVDVQGEYCEQFEQCVEVWQLFVQVQCDYVECCGEQCQGYVDGDFVLEVQFGEIEGVEYVVEQGVD